MKRTIKFLYLYLREARESLRIEKTNKFKKDRIEADIIRLSHSIEKGLCLKSPRPGFGKSNFNKLFALIEEYSNLEGHNKFCIYLCLDAMRSYFEYHNKIDFCDDDMRLMKERYDKLALRYIHEGECGGTQIVKTQDFKFELENVENLFNTRHSIRDFSGEKISDELIKKAIMLAQRCPSACNRQAFKVYRVDARQYIRDIDNNLEGIGGFAKDADSFLLVVSKKASYKASEISQHIVSSSMFAGYLSLALHAYGIAACPVQRPVHKNKEWDKYKKKYAIAGEEQLVMMFAIGGYKDKTTVPISNRFNIDEIYKKL